jgi:D-alanyl-D-alanine dipeptidase
MHSLVDIKAAAPKIRLEILYATSRNFTDRAVYPFECCYLAVATAERLKRVQAALERKGLGLKIYDGYRPLSVQKIFWNLVPDPRFVADPAKGSRHNRGTAVDVALVDAGGRDLIMPTPYDEFSKRAHRSYCGGCAEARANRNCLEEAMCAEEFIAYPEEWWHFDDPEWESYPILDIPFELLTRGLML